MSRFDKEALREVLSALRATKQDGPWERGMGICDNVEGLLVDDNGYDLPGYAAWVHHSKSAFETWARFSGEHTFPVHDPHAPGTPEEQYVNNNELGILWSGVQGELRQDLLHHLIIYFTNLMEEASVRTMHNH